MKRKSTLEDFVQDTGGWATDEMAIRMVTRQNVVEAMQDLPPRLRLVLTLRFGILRRPAKNIGGSWARTGCYQRASAPAGEAGIGQIAQFWTVAHFGGIWSDIVVS